MDKKKIIELYYQKIDAEELDWVVDLFTEDALYQRADMIYADRQSIAHFYRFERGIRGKHTLAGILAEGEVVAAYGKFEGVGADGSPRTVEFCDIWNFDGSKVKRRQSYLSFGSEYVKK